MPIQKFYWSPPFSAFPAWPCPECDAGRMIVMKDTLKEKETGPSLDLHSAEEWDPEFVDQRFCALLKCNNAACGEIASMSGRSGMSYYMDQDEEGEFASAYESVYTPKHIYPPIHMFQIPKKCPKTVKEQLVAGFGLVWADYISSMNKFRIAMEALLDDQGIAKYQKRVKGAKLKSLSLHARIERYRQKNADLAVYLEAIKWLGNDGSHNDSELTREHIFAAVDMIEYVVNSIYNPQHPPLKVAKKINKKKGPV